MGPYLIQIGIENPPATFTVFEGWRFMTAPGVSEDDVQGSVHFGGGATVPRNTLGTVIANIGAAGTRDSHSIFAEGKANDGATERAVWWRENINVTSQAGLSNYRWQQNLNGGGWFTRASLSDTGAFTAASLLSAQGNSVSNISAGGTAFADMVSAATAANTTETDLHTYTMPANSFNAVGKCIDIKSWGTLGNDANNKTIRLYFGGNVYSTTGTAAFGPGVGWSVAATICKTGTNTQTAFGNFTVGNSSPGVNQNDLAVTDTAPIVVKITGQNGTAVANDIVSKAMVINFMN
jgi:hypothetical protein